MIKTLARLVPLLAVSAVLLGAGGTAFARAGHAVTVSVGYTEESVTARNMGCRTARRLVRAALRVWDCDVDGCNPMNVRGYRCTVGGPAGLVVLKCRQARRTMRALQLWQPMDPE